MPPPFEGVPPGARAGQHGLMPHPEKLLGKSINLDLLQQMGVMQRDNASRVLWHKHAGFEILFLLEGATTYEFRAHGAVELRGGEFLIVPPRAVHRGRHNVRSPCRICGLVLSSQPVLPWRNSPFTRADAVRLGQSLRQSVMTVHSFNSSLRWTLRQLMDETAGYWRRPQDTVTQAKLRNLICGALLETVRQILSPARMPREIAAAAVNFLRQHHAEPVSMATLARHLGYSRSRTFELFKAEMGLTPNDYLQRVRMENACHLLRRTTLSVTDIALSVGFNSSQYFSTVFRRYTGRTPGAFRQTSPRRESNGVSNP